MPAHVQQVQQFTEVQVGVDNCRPHIAQLQLCLLLRPVPSTPEREATSAVVTASDSRLEPLLWEAETPVISCVAGSKFPGLTLALPSDSSREGTVGGEGGWETVAAGFLLVSSSAGVSGLTKHCSMNLTNFCASSSVDM